MTDRRPIPRTHIHTHTVIVLLFRSLAAQRFRCSFVLLLLCIYIYLQPHSDLSHTVLRAYNKTFSPCVRVPKPDKKKLLDVHYWRTIRALP